MWGEAGRPHRPDIKAIKDDEPWAVIPNGISQKKRVVWDYMPAHSEVTNKREIAKAVGVDRNTVRRHGEEIPREISRLTR